MFEPNPGPKNSPVWSRKAQNNSKIRSTLRVRIEGNIENGNCYCIWIEYDADNEEVEEEVEEEDEEGKEDEEEKVQGTRRQLFNMALILLGYNEIWLKINDTIGLNMHMVIHYKKAYWCFDVYIKYFCLFWNILSNAN